MLRLSMEWVLVSLMKVAEELIMKTQMEEKTAATVVIDELQQATDTAMTSTTFRISRERNVMIVRTTATRTTSEAQEAERVPIVMHKSSQSSTRTERKALRR